MKKKTQPSLAQTSYIASVELPKEALEEIYQIISKACKTVKVEDREYEYESLQEVFTKRRKRLKSIAITGYDPFITFQVRIKKGTGVYASGEESSLVPYFKIKSILENHKRKGRRWLFTGPPAVGILLAVSLVMLALPPLKQIPSWIRTVYVLITMLLMSALGALGELGYFSIINLQDPDETETFWERNRDTILVGIISAIVGGIIATGVAYLLFKQGIK